MAPRRLNRVVAYAFASVLILTVVVFIFWSSPSRNEINAQLHDQQVPNVPAKQVQVGQQFSSPEEQDGNPNHNDDNTEKEQDQSASLKEHDDHDINTNPQDLSPQEQKLAINQTELLVENRLAPVKSWPNQANESGTVSPEFNKTPARIHQWELCKFTGAADYIPCLDNKNAIKKSRKFHRRERHCPTSEELPKCLVPLPDNYQPHVNWPQSRNQIWYANVPHPGLVTYKKDQNWVRKQNDLLIFPGGGTQFKFGVEGYIKFIEMSVPEVSWGNRTRAVLDVGCGVASFGGYLLDRNVLTMSVAPKDEHEAQVQLALERGIPAMLAVIGTQRLSFPSNSYDAVHCARCRVLWHHQGGKPLVELDRIIRPGGYFLWSATPVYNYEPDDIQMWKETKALADELCWKMIVRNKDPRTGVGLAVFQKPISNSCYEKRSPTICEAADNADAAWYIPMKNCLHKLPTNGSRGSVWPQHWPSRLTETPAWLSGLTKGLYGKSVAEEFQADREHWSHVIQGSYANGLEIDWSTVRNVMDMNAGYGGFAAALSGFSVWVMNVVPVNEPDTLPIIFDRGLIGVYHDWCESFSTYPRTFDLLHADHLFSGISVRCGGVVNTILEMDRILRPEGWAIFRDTTVMFQEIEPVIKSLNWMIRVTYTQDHEQLLAAQKSFWRPPV